jgi:hypothetical protein
MDFNKRHENAFDRVLANKPELDRHSSQFLNTRISPERPVCATLASKPGKYEISPMGCRSKEGQVGQ